jgi:hypothetical protein
LAVKDAGKHGDSEYYMGVAQRAYGIEDDDETREAELVVSRDRSSGGEASYLDLL